MVNKKDTRYGNEWVLWWYRHDVMIMFCMSFIFRTNSPQNAEMSNGIYYYSSGRSTCIILLFWNCNYREAYVAVCCNNNKCWSTYWVHSREFLFTHLLDQTHYVLLVELANWRFWIRIFRMKRTLENVKLMEISMPECGRWERLKLKASKERLGNHHISLFQLIHIE